MEEVLVIIQTAEFWTKWCLWRSVLLAKLCSPFISLSMILIH